MENNWILPEGGPSVFDLKCDFIGSRGSFVIDASHHAAVQKVTAERTLYPDAFVAPTVHGRASGFGAESIRHFLVAVATRHVFQHFGFAFGQ
jgi:hypothetical protein